MNAGFPGQIAIGDRLTDYVSVDVEVQRVARGGFGVVYLGPDRLHVGRWCALKMLRSDVLAHSRRASDLFVREALTWVGLWPHAKRHPGAHGGLEQSGRAPLRAGALRRGGGGLWPGAGSGVQLRRRLGQPGSQSTSLDLAEARASHVDAALTHWRTGVGYAERAVALNSHDREFHRLLNALRDELSEAGG